MEIETNHSSKTSVDDETKINNFNDKLKLNTRGCCFLCLKVVDFKTDDVDNQEETETITRKQTVSLKHIHRYLQIKTRRQQSVTKTVADSGNELEHHLTQNNDDASKDIKVDLCGPCAKMILNFSRLFLSLEKIQMEVNYCLGSIQKQIAEAFKDPEVVKAYSKRMTRETESLPHLVIVDDLRKEIAWRSLLTRTGWEPNLSINLEPLQLNPVIEDRMQSAHHPAAAAEELSSVPIQIKSQPEEILPQNDSSNDDDFFPLENNQLNADDDSSPQENTIQPEMGLPQIKNVHSLNVPKMWTKKSSKRGFHCTSCNKTFYSSKAAQIHYESLHLFKTYKCEHCQTTFTSVHGLKLHQEKCNPDPGENPSNNGKKTVFNSKTGLFHCVAVGCKKGFVSNSGAWYHYQVAHLKKYFKCEICNLSAFASLAALEKHKKTCRETLESRLALNKERKTKFKFPCEYCDKRFAIKSQVVKHQKYVHENLRKYKCDLCAKSYKQIIHLSRHKDSAHFGRRWECKLCGKEFSYEDNFRDHKRICGREREENVSSESQPEVLVKTETE